MVKIPTQRRDSGSAHVYQAWAESGLGPDSTVDVGDGTWMTLRELLGEDDSPEPDDE